MQVLFPQLPLELMAMAAREFDLPVEEYRAAVEHAEATGSLYASTSNRGARGAMRGARTPGGAGRAGGGPGGAHRKGGKGGHGSSKSHKKKKAVVESEDDFGYEEEGGCMGQGDGGLRSWLEGDAEVVFTWHVQPCVM